MKQCRTQVSNIHRDRGGSGVGVGDEGLCDSASFFFSKLLKVRFILKTLFFDQRMERWELVL